MKTSTAQNIARLALGAFMIMAGTGHLTVKRKEFQAQVPEWVPMNKDQVVILSGIAEIALGMATLLAKKHWMQTGMALALFYVMVFPGNIAQYVNHTDAFGLDTDNKRFIRLFFQPMLIGCALWSTGALQNYIEKYKA